MKIVTILGTRPQFIKAGTVSREILRQKSAGADITEIIIHTGQHYDANMSDVFFEEMQIPKPDYFLGIGGIAKIRGIGQVVKAMTFTKGVRLNLAGKFSEQDIEKTTKSRSGWEKVDELGFLSRQEVADVLERSKIGLVTFLPSPNHIDSQPNKMFEYMSASIPIITSNFPLWREIVEGNECGLCVDPLNPKAIGEAIQYLIDNPAQAERMGENGRKAVEVKYNWPVEEKKLLDLYKDLKQ